MKNTFKYYAGMLLIGVTLANISCSSDEDGITPAEITNLIALPGALYFVGILLKMPVSVILK